MDERDAHREALEHRKNGGPIQPREHLRDVVRVVAVRGPCARAPDKDAHEDGAAHEDPKDELAAHARRPALRARKLLVLLAQLLPALAEVAHVAQPPTDVDQHEGNEGNGHVCQPGGGGKEVGNVLVVGCVVGKREVDGKHRIGAKGEGPVQKNRVNSNLLMI